MTVIFALLLCYPVLLALLFYGLNRGRVKGLVFAGDMLYALGIGVPMILAGYFRWLPEHGFITSILWVIPILLMVPFLLSKWVNVVKGRESALQAVSFSVALLFFYSTLYVTQFLAIVAVCVGMGFIVLFFVTSARYPYMNSGWLSRLIEETAAEIPQTGRYSTKPVSIEINISRRFFTGTHGLSLLAKQDRVICRISQRLHRKLGSPNLEAFFSLLCKKIEVMAETTG